MRAPCRKAERLLIRGWDADLRAEETKFLAAHFADCAHCRKISAQIQRQAEWLPAARSTDDVPPTAGTLVARAIAQWESGAVPAKREVRRRASYAPYAPLGWAMSGVAAVGVTAAVVAHHPQGTAAHELAAVMPSSQRASAATPPTRTLPRSAVEVRKPRRALPAPPRGEHALIVVRNGWSSTNAAEIATSPGPFRTPQPTMAQTDDLAAINADPSDSLNRWAQAAPDEWATLEAQVRASIRQGDDFVEVPFPRVAARNDRRIMSEAIAAYRQEAAIVDPHLQQEVSLSGKGVPLTDLCQQIWEQSGIEFAADPVVADDKITIFCTHRPLRDVMRQISRLLGFTWHRETSAAGYRYTLTQSLQAQLLEEDLRNRDRNTALAALDADMQGYRPYLKLSPDEAFQQGIEELHRQNAERAKKKTPSAESEDRLRRLNLLCSGGWAAIHLYFDLTTEQRDALGRQEMLTFNPPDMPTGGKEVTWYTLPGSMREPILQSLVGIQAMLGNQGEEAGWLVARRDVSWADNRVWPPTMNPMPDKVKVDLRTWAKTNPIYLSAFLKINQPELGKFTLSASSSFANPAIEGGAGESMDIAEGTSPSVRGTASTAPNRVELSAAMREALKRAPTVGLPALDPPPSAPPTQGALQIEARITSADALEALHKATGLDVIGDYYTRLYAPTAAALPKGTPLAEGLNRVSDALGLRWGVDEAQGKVTWLTFRDAGFFNDRPKEVPSRLLKHWAADRRATGSLPLTDLREIAELSDAQLDSASMEAGAIYLYDLQEWELATHGLPRPVWRFLQSLSQAQQFAVWGGGLTVGNLTPEQKQRMVAISYGFGDKATLIAGHYTVVPKEQQDLVGISGELSAFAAGKIDVDFREGDTSRRVGMGSFGF